MKPYPVIVIGGTGVFGRYIVEGLLDSGAPFQVTAAARNRAAFDRHFPQASSRLDFAPVDIGNRNSVEAALAGKELVILAAGPFQELPATVAEVAAERGLHYLDIGDDPAYAAKLADLKPVFQAAGKLCLTGLSSLPGISLPLAASIADRFDRIEKISIGLFIGNKNQKGPGAVMSAIGNLGRPVTVIRRGVRAEVPAWSEGEKFPYPAPIGPVPSYSFNSPDPMVFPDYFPCAELSVKVGFEWALARLSFSIFKFLVRRGAQRLVQATTKLLFPCFALMHYFGSERGAVSVVLTGSKGSRSIRFRASLWGQERSQRMAAMPCVVAAEALVAGECNPSAVSDLLGWLPPASFLDRLAAKGFEVEVEELS
ncbi:MAG: saccharopine dehydrogenase NADP-binding domain-containing protein [bacterium]